MTQNDAAEVARRLTRAQREGLERAPCPSWWGPRPGCMPHARQTTFALYRKGIVERVLLSSNAAALTPFGLEGRALLLKEKPNV